MTDLKTKLGLKDSLWARLIGPFSRSLADWRERRKFRRVGYFGAKTCRGRHVIVEALENGYGKRKLYLLERTAFIDRLDVAEAWRRGDDSTRNFMAESFPELVRRLEEIRFP